MFLEEGQLASQIDDTGINGIWDSKVDQFAERKQKNCLN